MGEKYFHPYLFCCAPSGARFQQVKVPNSPDSGKDVAFKFLHNLPVGDKSFFALGTICRISQMDQQRQHSRHRRSLCRRPVMGKYMAMHSLYHRFLIINMLEFPKELSKNNF